MHLVCTLLSLVWEPVDHLRDFVHSFSGFRAQRARETPLNGQRVPNTQSRTHGHLKWCGHLNGAKQGAEKRQADSTAVNRSLQIEGKSQLWVFCDLLWKLYSVEHWKVGLCDCSGISHAFTLTRAMSMQTTQQRWEWEPISNHLFGRSGVWNCSIFGIHEAIKIFGIPQSRAPFTFSQQSCAVFGIHNFGISNPKFRNLRF